MSLQETEDECAANAKAPRVTMSAIASAIAEVHYRTGAECVGPAGGPTEGPLAVLTVAFVVMRNGFTIIGKSAPASPENFNVELGRKLAHEDAMRQIWPLMGFSLRDCLWRAGADLAEKSSP